MIKHKGIGGGTIVIDENNVKLKFAFLKEECQLLDITLVEFEEPQFLMNGNVAIYTNEHSQAPFSLVFSKSKRDEFYELYQYLEENTSSAATKAVNALNMEKRLSEPPLEDEGGVRCPKCGSASISANKKGFGVGKAVIGAAVAGPIGLVAGNVGAKKLCITCLNCGYQWTPGKA